MNAHLSYITMFLPFFRLTWPLILSLLKKKITRMLLGNMCCIYFLLWQLMHLCKYSEKEAAHFLRLVSTFLQTWLNNTLFSNLLISSFVVILVCISFCFRHVVPSGTLGQKYLICFPNAQQIQKQRKYSRTTRVHK